MDDLNGDCFVAFVDTQKEDETRIKLLNLRGSASDITFSSANSDILGFASNENEVIIYNMGTDTFTCALHSYKILSIASSPDGKCMAALAILSGYADPKEAVSCTLLDSVTGDVLFEFKLPRTRGHGTLEFSADGQLLGVGTEGKVEIWDIASRQCLQTIGMGTHCFCFSPMDNSKLFCGSYGSIDVIDIGQHEIMSPPNTRIPPAMVKLSPDGTMVACWQSDVLKFSSTASGAHLVDICAGNSGEYLSFQFSPDSSQLAFRSDLSLEVWNISSEKAEQTYIEKSPSSLNQIKQMTFSPNCQYLAIAEKLISGHGDAASIRILDIGSGNCLTCFRTITSRPIIGLLIAFSPDSKQLASCLTFDDSGAQESGIQVWDIASASTTHTLIISNDDFKDHMRSQFERLRTFNGTSDPKPFCFSPSKMSFSDDNHLLLTSESRLEEGLSPNVKIKVILTFKPSSTLKIENSNENLLVEEESNNDIYALDLYPQDSWVILNGERVVWLPPEYRISDSERSWNTIDGCIAISNSFQPIFIMKFDCSERLGQVAAQSREKRQGTPHTSKKHKRSHASGRDEETLTLRLEMGLPDGKTGDGNDKD